MIQIKMWQYTPSSSRATEKNQKSTTSECIIITNKKERKCDI